MEYKSEEYNNKRYSACSESEDLTVNLTGNDIAFPLDISSKDIKNSKADVSEREPSSRVYLPVPAPPPLPEPPIVNHIRSSYNGYQSSFGKHSIAEDFLRTPMRNRYQYNSIEDFSSAALSTENDNQTGKGEVFDKSLIELQSEHSELNHSSSQPHFNSSSDIIYAAKELRKLKKKWVQEDLHVLSNSNSVTAKPRSDHGGPQLASSDDVTFPLPLSVRPRLDGKKTKRYLPMRTSESIGAEENLVNKPLKARIKARTLANPYALLDDDDDAERERIIEAQLTGFYQKALSGNISQSERTLRNQLSRDEERKQTFFPLKQQMNEVRAKEKVGKKVVFFTNTEMRTTGINNLVVPQPPSRGDIPQKYQRTNLESTQHISELHKKKNPLFPSVGLPHYPNRFEGSGRNEDRNDSIASENSAVQCQTPLRSQDFTVFQTNGEIFSQSLTGSDILSPKFLEGNSSGIFKRSQKSKEAMLENSSSQNLNSAWRMPLVGKEDVFSLSQSSDRVRETHSQNPPGGQSLSSSHRLNSEKFPQLPKYLPVPITARIIGIPLWGKSTNRIPQTTRERMRGCDDNIRRTTSQTDLMPAEAKRTI